MTSFLLRRRSLILHGFALCIIFLVSGCSTPTIQCTTCKGDGSIAKTDNQAKMSLMLLAYFEPGDAPTESMVWKVKLAKKLLALQDAEFKCPSCAGRGSVPSCHGCDGDGIHDSTNSKCLKCGGNGFDVQAVSKNLIQFVEN